jgi:uncharacterized repeat protein (TIGR03847 family)
MLREATEAHMHDFGKVDTFEAEAIGQPGQRTFRLRIRNQTDAASIWLEKEQLAALSLAIRQILAQVSGGKMTEPRSPSALSPDFPSQPSLELKVGRLGLGYDASEATLVLFAYELEEEHKEDSPPFFTCRVSQEQSRALCDMADAVVTAGRPICPLCDGPIDPEGHVCPRSNGHPQWEVSL